MLNVRPVSFPTSRGRSYTSARWLSSQCAEQVNILCDDWSGFLFITTVQSFDQCVQLCYHCLICSLFYCHLDVHCFIILIDDWHHITRLAFCLHTDGWVCSNSTHAKRKEQAGTKKQNTEIKATTCSSITLLSE